MKRAFLLAAATTTLTGCHTMSETVVPHFNNAVKTYQESRIKPKEYAGGFFGIQYKGSF